MSAYSTISIPFYLCNVKCRSVLFGQWGFGKTEEQGLTVLFHGAPGTGKSLTAEAVGYEVGKPLKVLMRLNFSKPYASINFD